MAELVPGFATEIKKYGADSFNACYNCGSCTAVCNLTDKDANFPRMFIRYGLLGKKDDILNSKEIWLCYSCGDCSETCPREADPCEYMAALRRYAIASYEPTGLTKLMFKSNPFALITTILLAVILGFFVLTLKPDEVVARWIFDLMPFEILHDMGMIIFGFTGLVVVITLLRMFFHLRKSMGGSENSGGKSKFGFINAIKKVSIELGIMKRYQDCDMEEDSYWFKKSWFVKPWFVHWTIMWGFIGLLLATALNFAFKDPATTVWWPTRILGTVTGIFLMYGTSLALYYRITKPTKSYGDIKLADWWLLIFLWAAGLTGFWLEIAVVMDAAHMVNHIVFIIHTIISMELVLLFAFSKFAHAVYRPLALFCYYWKH